MKSPTRLDQAFPSDGSLFACCIQFDFVLTPFLSFFPALLIALYAVAFFLTSARVFYRYRIGRLWWDDAWATVALVFGIGQLLGGLWTSQRTFDPNDEGFFTIWL